MLPRASAENKLAYSKVPATFASFLCYDHCTNYLHHNLGGTEPVHSLVILWISSPSIYFVGTKMFSARNFLDNVFSHAFATKILI